MQDAEHHDRHAGQLEELVLVLEDGQLVSFTNATPTGIDVVYENMMDDTLIAETWEHGMPWATASITPTTPHTA